MLLPLDGRRLYYDLAGPESGPVVGFTHSLSSDSGMWAEQVPTLLAAGFRVLRIDMRGHGGSDPVAGDYTMDQLAADVATVTDALGIAQLHYIGLSIGGMIGQAFALNHGVKLKSLMLCDTSPGSPPDAKETWAPRIAAVTKANSLAPLADGTMERWFTEAFKARNPGRWRQIHDTIEILDRHRARFSRLRGGDPEFRLCAAPADAQDSNLGRLRRRGSRHAAEREQADRRARPRRPLRGDRKGAPSPECRAPGGVQPHHDGLARRTPLAHPGRRKSVVPG
jgi:pimeloyl-ACP methyl ester carboxylesterase